MAVSIYQIQYSDDVIGFFDPAFNKYDCRETPELEKREVAHMLRFYDNCILGCADTEYFGLVSPKFSSKAGVSGQEFIKWIESNPGYDVYFINPFPQLAYWNFNVWTQGEFWHPGLTDLANALFSAAGYSIRVEDLPRNTAVSLLYSNYWVGNNKFWQRYMDFVRKLVTAVDGLCSKDRAKIFALAPHYAQATYFPFVFERLFSTFILLDKGLSSLHYHYSREEISNRCENDMENFVIHEWGGMIDGGDALERNDVEYRKIFDNLNRMLQIYHSNLLNNTSPDAPLCKGGLFGRVYQFLFSR
jgi:hypothetical protein